VLVAAIGSRCPYCSELMAHPSRHPSRDHIKPRARGYTLKGGTAGGRRQRPSKKVAHRSGYSGMQQFELELF